MRILTTVCLLCFAANLPAQRLDIAALQSSCLPAVPLTTLNAIIRVESGGNPNAMQIDFPRALLKRWHLPEGALQLKREPATKREALVWLNYFERHGISVDLGLMQVSTAEAQRVSCIPFQLGMTDSGKISNVSGWASAICWIVRSCNSRRESISS